MGVAKRSRGLSVVWQVASQSAACATHLKAESGDQELRNAVKFTDQGQVTVGVHPRNEGVEIWVADTGIGIGPETAPGIFELFRQADGSGPCPWGRGGGTLPGEWLLAAVRGHDEVRVQWDTCSTFPLDPNRRQSVRTLKSADVQEANGALIRRERY